MKHLEQIYAVLLLILDDVLIEEELSKTIDVIASFGNDQESEKQYGIVYEYENYIAINMNKHVEKQLNDIDCNISQNHALINKINDDYI